MHPTAEEITKTEDELIYKKKTEEDELIYIQKLLPESQKEKF
jgi:hypothetical protein